MKKSIIFLSIWTISSLLISCKKDEINTYSSISEQINNFPKEALSTDETISLLVMREEEKLAYDVYTTLYKKWGLAVFNNISSSELTHTTAVLTLLNRYNIADPVGKNAVGIFENSTLQALYNQLVAQGSISITEAVKVGATIEDLDIFDLHEWQKKVDNQDINFVYDNLTKGSRNHLRSFYGQVLNQNSTYKAQYITQTEFDAIIDSPKETNNW
jgi:hypothetical protein